MQRYIVLRILQAIAALLVISMIVFALARVTGDPVAILLPEDAPQKVVDQVREKWGLDQPIYVQYIKYIGTSYRAISGRPGRTAESPFQASSYAACPTPFISPLLRGRSAWE